MESLNAYVVVNSLLTRSFVNRLIRCRLDSLVLYPNYYRWCRTRLLLFIVVCRPYDYLNLVTIYLKTMNERNAFITLERVGCWLPDAKYISYIKPIVIHTINLSLRLFLEAQSRVALRYAAPASTPLRWLNLIRASRVCGLKSDDSISRSTGMFL